MYMKCSKCLEIIPVEEVLNVKIEIYNLDKKTSFISFTLCNDCFQKIKKECGIYDIINQTKHSNKSHKIYLYDTDFY